MLGVLSCGSAVWVQHKYQVNKLLSAYRVGNKGYEVFVELIIPSVYKCLGDEFALGIQFVYIKLLSW